MDRKCAQLESVKTAFLVFQLLQSPSPPMSREVNGLLCPPYLVTAAPRRLATVLCRRLGYRTTAVLVPYQHHRHTADRLHTAVAVNRLNICQLPLI